MVLGHLDLPGNLVCQNYPKNRNTSFILYNCMHWYQISSGKKTVMILCVGPCISIKIVYHS